MKISSCLNNTPYRPRKVLGVSRLSFLEFLRFQNPELNEDQILSKMKEQGKDPVEILTEHQRQIACEQNLAAVLRKLDISFRITKRMGDASKCVNWADLVVPIGGDGTFLLASNLIKDNRKPVFGINPNVSGRGNIFALPSKTLVRSTQRKIADSLQPRQRILPWLALNEVEEQETFFIRCTGICVCTGSGSRSWYKSMNSQSGETVRSIVEIATGKKLSPEETNELLYKYHRALLYPPEGLQMTYAIREMYHTTRCTKYKCCPDRQRCFKLTVKSRGFDAGLVIDGSISLPFNDGTTASFEIKPEYSLRNIVLS